MTKLKTPLLSFRAQGSIGKQLTFAGIKGGTIAKTIPSHRDARTLPQLYQRWRFRDAIYYWKWLPEFNRAAYKVAARPLNMTGWAYFLSQYLPDPPDQVLWLRNDEQAGNALTDFSGKGNHATIFGAVPAVGVIDLARYFDGIDDKATIPNATTLTLNHLTMMCFLQQSQPSPASANIFGNEVWAGGGYKIEIDKANRWCRAFIDIAGAEQQSGNVAIEWDAPYHVAFTYDGTWIRAYFQGILLDTAGPFAGNIGPPAIDLWLANAQNLPTRWSKGWQDDNRIYNRACSPAQILEIATTQFWPTKVI